MCKYNEINSKLSAIAADRHVELTPSLQLLDNGNIQKYYHLSGNPWDCDQAIQEADILGYTADSQNKLEIAQDCAYYEPEDEEAEAISAALESDKDWDDILDILVDIVKEYDFDEESYYIRSAYTPNGDEFYDIYQSFDDISDFEDWIEDHINKELFLYTQNVYENFRSAEEVEEYSLLPDLADWANALLKIAQSDYYYYDEKDWIDNLVQEWKKTDELTY